MASRKVNILADSTCDLSNELAEQYGITIVPLCIVLDDKSYFDGTEIKPDQIYEWADANKKTPKTAAVSMEMIHDILEPLMEADEDVIFFGISESMSTTCNVVRLMGNDFDKGRLFVIDSMSLSSGEGLQVLRAAELVKEGWSADQIVEKINNDRKLVRASFVVDTLTYLARGGRCSGAAALVAGAIKLHPCIKVCDGKMVVNKKYRGTLPRALKGYFDDLVPEMAHADKKRVFVTHSGVEEEVLSEMTRAVEELHYFDEVIVARAGGVISSHCGPGTLGVLYYMQEEE